MPAYGGGIGPRAPGREPKPAAPWRAPLANAPAYRPPSQVFHGGLPKANPFAGGQAQAQRQVTKAVLAGPQARVPHIPFVANPSREQAREALRVAATHMRSIGQKAFAELGQDPRNHQYLETVQHYLHAFTGQESQGLKGLTNQFAAQQGALQQGFMEKGYRGLAAERAKQAAQASPLNLGFVDLTPLATAAATLAQKAGIGEALGGTPGKLINEAIDLPGQTFLSSAIAGGAAREGVIGGNWNRAETIGKGLLSQVEHPVQSFKEAPLATALTLAGGENALARIVGKSGRWLTAADKAVELNQPLSRFQRALSTERPNLKLWNGLEKAQQYNKDPLRKLAQVGYEKSLPRLPGGLKQADPFQAEGWRLQHNLIGGIVHPGRADYIVAGADRQRRTLMAATSKVAQDAIPVDEHGKPFGQHLVPLITQRIVRTPATMEHDLLKERAKLQAAQADLKGGELAKNRANLARVQEVLANPKLMADPAPAFEAAAKVEAVQRPLEAALVHGGKLQEGQLRAALFPYAQAHMGAVHDGSALRGPNGAELTNQQIIAHMKQTGLEPPTFLSHREGIAGSGSYYHSTSRFPGLARHARTGSAFAKGTAEHSWESLMGTVAHQASDAAQLQVKAQNLSKLSQTPKEGGFATRQDAAKYIHENLEHTPAGEPTGAPRFVPIHLGPNQILERGHVTPGEIHDTLAQFGLSEHSPQWAQQNGKFGVTLASVDKRLADHEGATSAKSDIAKALQAYTQGFRHAKLNTSTRHIAGVIQEQGIRLGAEQAGPRAAKAGKAARQALEGLSARERAALADTHGPLGSHFQELEGMLANRGGLTASQSQMDIRRSADQFRETSASGVVMRAGHDFFRTTLPGNVMLKAWRGWEHVITDKLLVPVESFTHDAMLGKALRESGFIENYRSVIRMQDQAVQDLIAGKMTANKADHLARQVDEMMGNWTHLTPNVRRAVSTITPFGLWWLNSMRWLYRLPVTHPIKTGIAAALYRATEAERNKLGQGMNADSPVPAFLQGTIETHLPVVGKVQVNPSYYSPMGTLGPNAGQTAAEQIAPQVSSVLAALEGRNPLTNEKLTDSKGKQIGPLSVLLNALSETAAGPVPFATQAQQALQGGGKPYGTANLLTDLIDRAGGPAQVKPGTERSVPEVLTKMLSPLRFDFPGKAKGKEELDLSKLTPAERSEIEAAERSAGSTEETPAERSEREAAERVH